MASEYFRIPGTYLLSMWLTEFKRTMVPALQDHLEAPRAKVLQCRRTPLCGGMCLSNFDCTGAPGASKAWSESLHFSLSIFCHGCFLRQTFHSHLKAKQYFSREVTGKQPSPLMQKKTNITPGLNCLQGDPAMKESLQSIWYFFPHSPFVEVSFTQGLKGK